MILSLQNGLFYVLDRMRKYIGYFVILYWGESPGPIYSVFALK